MYIDTTPDSVPSRALSSSCLLADGQTLLYLIGLQFLHRFVQFRLLLRQMQLGNSHDLLHMLNSSCKAVSSTVAPHIHWITSCSSTSMHRPLSWDLEQLELLTEKAPDDSLVIRAWVTGHMHQKKSSQLNWPALCLVQTTGLVHVDGTYIGQVIISWYFQTLLCLTFEVQHNLCCTYDDQKSERAFWFLGNSR